MDPLADVLDLSRVSGALLAQLVAHEPWGIAIDRQSGATFHAIVAGDCWLRVPGAKPRRMMPGDVVLLPTNAPHDLLSAPDAAAKPFDRVTKESLRTPAGEVELPGSGAITRILCAAYDYDHEVAQPLLSLLPAVLHLPAGDPASDGAVESTLRLLTLELGSGSPGSQAAAARLIDVLLIHVVRAWLRAHAEGDASWLVALRDPVAARALALLHERPDDAWTVERLAQEVSVSRATLSRRFTELVGEPPLGYLTRWRMDLAAKRLRDTDDTLAAIAGDVGYTSEYAFARAFARERGEPPGRYRRRARERAT
jgi:AraC-like DNA-binding protein